MAYFDYQVIQWHLEFVGKIKAFYAQSCIILHEDLECIACISVGNGVPPEREILH